MSNRMLFKRRGISKIITTLGILAVALIGVGLIAAVSLGMFQNSSMMPYAELQDSSLMTSKLSVTIANKGNLAITEVNATCSALGLNDNQVTGGSSLRSGATQTFTWTLTTSATSGDVYTVSIKVTFAGGSVRTYTLQFQAS